MKRLLLVGIILLASSLFRLPAQPCSWLTFTTQSQIDSFAINYPNCTEIAGYLRIVGGDITNLDGLLGVTNVQGELEIEYTNITDLSGLDSLKTVGLYFTMSQNNSLETLDGLQNLSFVYQGISINGCDALVELTGLSNVDWSTTGHLEVANTSLLENLWGLESLNEVINGLEIRNNASLSSLSGLESLEWTGGSIYIRDNPSLNSLTSLNNLDSIAGELWISDNDSLDNLDGLYNLSYIEGYLIIEDNDALYDINGLSNLRHIFWVLQITDNTSLISLSGLDSIDAQGIYQMDILGNSSLSTCHIYSVCNFLVYGGIANIYNNAVGCNTPQQVADSCGIVGIESNSVNIGITSYPNPFNTSITIEYELTEPTHIQLTIYNHLGEVIEEAVSAYKLPGVHNYVWSVERLSEGMYFAVLRSGDRVTTTKLIKQ